MYKYTIICLLLLILGTQQLDNGMGLTPPMGWNSWNHFACKINENLIKQTADALVSTGLAAKGYKYLNLDDCWQADRNKTTNVIIPDKNFPSGMAALGQYIHSKGLYYGLYSDAGYKTCQGRPGSFGYQTIDAQTYASWKVDYLKYDNCNTDGSSPKLRYPIMRNALNKTGRRIFYSMCEWGVEDPATWAGPVANSWRTTGDISDSWSSFIKILQKQVGLQKYAGPGGWNDPDMLQVGNGKMTKNQYQAHFALWAALKAPLLIGCDILNMSRDTLEILGNQEIIAINQDALGIQAGRLFSGIYDKGIKQIWGGKLSGDRMVVILFNQGIGLVDFNFKLSETLKLPIGTIVSIRDVVSHTDLGIFQHDDVRFIQVPSHSVRVLVLTIYPPKAQMME